ncbi:MAG: hypothetical protein K6A65_01215 [Succinivibrionaceae bacterium]|nr:hypothetical protein [Succinivibrionaceae bacterium]
MADNEFSKQITHEKLTEAKYKGSFFTLDQEGKLTAVVPPRKRDNFLVAFFKGNLQWNKAKRAAYNQKQLLLDNMEKLQKNFSFHTKVMQTLLNKQREMGFYKSERAITLLEEEFKNLVVNNKERSRSYTVFYSKLSEYHQKSDRHNFLADACGSQQFMGKSGNASLIYDGKCQNVFSFMKAYGAPAGEGGASKGFFKDGKLDFDLLTTKVISRCLEFPGDFEYLGPGVREDAERISEMLNTSQEFVGDDEEQKAARRSVTNIFDALKLGLSRFAQKAIDSGKHPEAVARALQGMMNELCGPIRYHKKSGSGLKNLFDPKKMEARIRGLPDAPQGRPAPPSWHVGEMQKRFGCTPEQGIRGQAYLEENNITDRLFDDIRQNVDGENFGSLTFEWDRCLAPVNSARLLATMDSLERITGKYFKPDAELDNVHVQECLKAIALQSMLRAKDKTALRTGINTMLSALNSTLRPQSDFMKGPDSDFRTKVQRQMTLLRDTMQHMRNILNEQYPETERIKDQARAEKLKSGIQALLGNFAALKEVHSRAVQGYITEKLQLFPENCRVFAGRYLTEQAMVRAGAEGGDRERIKGYIDDIAKTLRDQENVLLFASDKQNSKEFNDKFMQDYFLNDHDLGLGNVFADQRKNIGPSGYHSNFDRDIKGYLLRKINGNPQVYSGDFDAMAASAREDLNEIVPEAFRPFVSTTLMQGGLGRVLPALYGRDMQLQAKEGAPAMNPVSIFTKERHVVNNACYCEVSRNGDTLSIDLYASFGLTPQDNKEKNGVVPMNTQKPIFVKNEHVRVDFSLNSDNLDTNTGIPKEIKCTLVGESHDAPYGAFASKFR